MIEIKLSFASIDEAIAYLQGSAPKAAQAQEPATGPATAKGGAAPKKMAAAPSPAAPSAGAQPQASTAATDEGNAAAVSSAPAAAPAPAASSVDYATLQKAVFTLAGKSREAAAQVASTFGVKTFKELPEDRWADALAAVQAKTAEL